MANTYYYFSATLPFLQFKDSLPFSVEEFLRQAEGILSEDDYAFVTALLSNQIDLSEIKNDLYIKIFQQNQDFRNALAAFRAERAGKDALDYVRGSKFKSAYLDEVFHQAAKEHDLLQGQRLIDQAYWSYLEELEMGHFNDLIFISVFGLKLKVLERYERVESNEGRDKFEEYKNNCLPEELGV
jgi:hypothetical protein